MRQTARREEAYASGSAHFSFSTSEKPMKSPSSVQIFSSRIAAKLAGGGGPGAGERLPSFEAVRRRCQRASEAASARGGSLETAADLVEAFSRALTASSHRGHRVRGCPAEGVEVAWRGTGSAERRHDVVADATSSVRRQMADVALCDTRLRTSGDDAGSVQECIHRMARLEDARGGAGAGFIADCSSTPMKSPDDGDINFARIRARLRGCMRPGAGERAVVLARPPGAMPERESGDKGEMWPDCRRRVARKTQTM